GLDALPRLGVLGGDGEGVVGIDGDVGARIERGAARTALTGHARRVEADDQAAARDGADLEERAAIYLAFQRVMHGYALPPLAACLMAALFRRYVPQRDTLHDIAASISASVAFGVFERSADADIS